MSLPVPSLPFGYVLFDGSPVLPSYYVVVYAHRFEALFCDHHIPASISVDLYCVTPGDAGTIDSIVACPDCLPDALKVADEIWV